jgi:lysozyme
MSKLRNSLGGITVAGALAVGVIGQYEGTRYVPYYDSVHVLTVCQGETKDVRKDHVYTKAECDAMFGGRLDEFATHVEACAHGDMPKKTEVAFVSLAYNIGWAGFCKSSVVRHWNSGDHGGACNAMMNFNRAGGRELPGLTRRRNSERTLCLQGLKEGMPA